MSFRDNLYLVNISQHGEEEQTQERREREKDLHVNLLKSTTTPKNQSGATYIAILHPDETLVVPNKESKALLDGGDPANELSGKRA